MITIQLPGAAVFFPDEEITEAKAVTSGGAPSIAFKSAGTGGLQFVKRFKSTQERDKTLQDLLETIKNRSEKEDLMQIMADRIRMTEQELERMRKEQREQKPKKEKKTQAKKPKRTADKKAAESKPFEPPSDEEMIDYISGDQKLTEALQKVGNTPESTVQYFRSLYEKERETGEKDESGFSVREVYWEDKTGTAVQNWKNKLRQHILHGVIFDEKDRSRSTGNRTKKNAFNEFKQNVYTDEELEEIVNSSAG